MTLIRKKATNNMEPALIKVQLRNAAEGSMPPKAVMARIPRTDATRPIIAIRIGKAMYSNCMVAIPAPIAMVAIMEPQ